MPTETVTEVQTHPAVRGVPPRYQVFDRSKRPPKTVGLLYDEAPDGGLVVEVYDDVFREFLKRDPAFAGRRFDWVLDVEPDAPHDTRRAIVRPRPMPAPADRGAADDPPLGLEEAVAACAAPEHYRVIRTSDPR